MRKGVPHVDVQIEWRGQGAQRGIDASSGKTLIEVDPHYFRPTEVDLLLGNSSKARQRLGWSHQSNVDDLVSEIVREDLKTLGQVHAQCGTTSDFWIFYTLALPKHLPLFGHFYFVRISSNTQAARGIEL